MDKNTTYGYFRVMLPETFYDGEELGYMCVRLDRPPKEQQGVGQYKASFSFCSPSDSKHFTKRLARKIADARMNTKRVKSYIEFENTVECPKLANILQLAIDKAITLEIMPTWYEFSNRVIPGLRD